MKKKRTKFNRNIVAVLHDAVMAGVSFPAALYLRLGSDMLPFAEHYLVPGAISFSVICLTTFIYMRLYRGLWRYASAQDFMVITKAVTLSIFVFYTLLFLSTRLDAMPRAVPVIHWLLLLFMLGGPRFLYRVVKDRRLRLLVDADGARIPVLLVGAGEHAEWFVRSMQKQANAPYRVVGVIDNNPSRIGGELHGARIYGPLDAMERVVEKITERVEAPQKILIAAADLKGSQVRKLLAAAFDLRLPLAQLPRLKSVTPGRIEVRPIAIEDLLGRPQASHDEQGMRNLVAGKRVMITGAGGTIGSELVRQIAGFGPERIILYEQSEYHLYQIDLELSERFPDVARASIIGDVRDAQHIDKVCAREAPEILFHAAAIKHVPIAEANPAEALLTNTLGTRYVADACVRHKVGSMVLISTDKAVNPTNLMGASKRLAEAYIQALGQQSGAEGTRFLTVRFGNVLGSTGSVVPLFTQQLARGGPLTVTHPEMTRYFMTVREAVELVLEAAVLAGGMRDQNGLIFVLDMGEPVKILDLAEQMIRLAGFRPHEDILITYTGLRPGEKMFEELFHGSEELAETAHASIRLAFPRHGELARLQGAFDTLRLLCQQRKPESEAIAIVREMVPEFRDESAAQGVG